MNWTRTRSSLWLALGAAIALRLLVAPPWDPAEPPARHTEIRPLQDDRNPWTDRVPPDLGPDPDGAPRGGPPPEFRGGPGFDPRRERGPGFRGEGRPRRPPTPIRPAIFPVPPDLWRFHIEVAPSDAETLRGYAWRGWGGQMLDRPEVQVTVREGDRVYTNVALHLKGSAGSFRPFDDKPALTLNFSKHAPGQEFHGYRKLSLNNSVQDPSFLSEIICREIFLAAGIPVPKASHATVLLNDRDLGLYVLTEGWGKPFLRQHFHQVGGNLYDGGFLKDIDADLEVNSGDHPEDRSDLERLRDAAFETDPDRRRARLAQALDLDRFLTFVALEVLLGHWDGYALNRNNYRLFHHLETGRMIFLPHGLDQMFGVGRSHPQSTIFPRLRGLVAQAVLQRPENQDAYLDRLESLLATVVRTDQVTDRILALASRLRPTLAAYGEDVAQAHDQAVEQLIQRVAARVSSVQAQLAAARPTPPPIGP